MAEVDLRLVMAADMSGSVPHALAGAQRAGVAAAFRTGVLPDGLGTGDPYATLLRGDDGPLADFYRDEVIGGPGTIAIEAGSMRDFADAMRRKLVMEIAWNAADHTPR